MTNFLSKKVPVGTIANSYEITNNRLYRKYPNWLLLDGSGVGSKNCLYAGNKYKLLYDHLNGIIHSNRKVWGVDVIHMQSCLESVGVNGLCGEVGTYGGAESSDNTVIQHIKSTSSGFINNVRFGVVNAGGISWPLSRDLCFFRNESGNIFTLTNKVKMDFTTEPPPSANNYSYYSVKLPTCIYIDNDTYIGVYPGVRMTRSNTAGNLNYYFASSINIGETKTFSTAIYPIDLYAVVINAKSSYYISY